MSGDAVEKLEPIVCSPKKWVDCAHCGSGRAIEHHGFDSHIVVCGGCGATAPASIWNKRITNSNIVEHWAVVEIISNSLMRSGGLLPIARAKRIATALAQAGAM